MELRFHRCVSESLVACSRSALALGGKQQNVGVRFASPLPHPAAHFQARHPRHHPIQDCKRRRVVLLEHRQRLFSVAGHHHFVAPLTESGFQ